MSMYVTGRVQKYKHGYYKHPLYANVYFNMKRRCYDSKTWNYKNYGGRGIRVCNKWNNDVVKFIEWALINGYGKGLQIDRINNDGDYSPDNCRFVTPKENSNNRRECNDNF